MNELIVFDSEVMPSHYLFKARRLSDRKVISLWGSEPAHMERLGALLRNPGLTWIGFNSNNFDIPLAIAAAGGRTVTELKAMANDIINNGKPAWMTMRDYGIEYPENLDTVDLIEVAPGVMVSLKLYGARMGSPSLVDMPFHHEDFLTAEQAKVLDAYCENDLDETERLLNACMGRLKLREKMTERYGINLMSKSDAQMAETIIAKELGLLRAGKPEIPKTVRYSPPSFVQPQSAILQDILQRTAKHIFTVKQSNGAVELPAFLADEPVILGDGVFQMGIGGLHSKHDKSVHYVATPEFEIVDADVGSFYPNIILNAGFVPRGLGSRFVELFRSFVTERLSAKHEAKLIEKMEKEIGNLPPEIAEKLVRLKIIDAGGKIMINGTFGKLGSCFAKIYAPDLMLGVTLTGQFYLLSVIEVLAEMGLKIISVNTDGIAFGGPPELTARARDFIDVYGWVTNFEFEYTYYRSISLKDCNNYIAVKTNGDVKAKGLYAEAGLQKNPTNEISSIAAAAYLANNTPIKETVFKHLNIEHFTDFLQARNVKGGAVEYGKMVEVDDWVELEGGGAWRRPCWLDERASVKRKSRPNPVMVGVEPKHLGRVARWYYSTDPQYSNGLRYASNDNLVPKSTGGRPCMILPFELPADIDVQRYIDEAVSHLNDMGVYDVKG